MHRSNYSPCAPHCLYGLLPEPDATKIDTKVRASELDPLDISSTLEGCKAPCLAQDTMSVSDHTVSQGSHVINGILAKVCASSGC